MRERILLEKEDKPYPGQAAFPHIMGGMDAGYYGYLYALCFATDMYWSVFKADPLDSERGMRYRKSILEPGGSRDELVSLEVRAARLTVLTELSMSYFRSSSGVHRPRKR